jgi:hypothetical protein
MHDVLSKYPEDVVKRSNCACESFNSDLIRRVKAPHPNIYTLVEVLRHIEHSRMREWKNEDICNYPLHIRNAYKPKGILIKKLRESRHLDTLIFLLVYMHFVYVKDNCKYPHFSILSS